MPEWRRQNVTVVVRQKPGDGSEHTDRLHWYSTWLLGREEVLRARSRGPVTPRIYTREASR